MGPSSDSGADGGILGTGVFHKARGSWGAPVSGTALGRKEGVFLYPHARSRTNPRAVGDSRVGLGQQGGSAWVGRPGRTRGTGSSLLPPVGPTPRQGRGLCAHAGSYLARSLRS